MSHIKMVRLLNEAPPDWEWNYLFTPGANTNTINSGSTAPNENGYLLTTIL